MIRDVHSDPNLDFLPIPDPGSRGQKGTGSWIRNTDARILIIIMVMIQPILMRIRMVGEPGLI
jgi:hypothetical protein